MLDLISVEERFIIVEAKGPSLGLGMRQCLLTMKGIGDNDGCVGEM